MRRRQVRRTLILALLLSVTGCASRPDRGPRPVPMTISYPFGETPAFPGHRAVAQQALSSYVRLTVYERGDGPPPRDLTGRTIVIASGTLVGHSGYLVTAAHIARDPHFGVRVRTADGRNHEAKILDVAPGKELALLRMDTPPSQPVAPLGGPAPPPRGAPVLAMGSPHLGAAAVSLGCVRLPKRHHRLTYNEWGFDNGIELYMEVESGNSGGPVLDAKGRIVGMIASYLLGDTTRPKYVSPGIAFAVPAGSIRAYLRENGVRQP